MTPYSLGTTAMPDSTNPTNPGLEEIRQAVTRLQVEAIAKAVKEHQANLERLRRTPNE